MHVEHIRPFLGRDRFDQFDVRTASGNSYRVRGPEMAWLSPDRSTLLVRDIEAGVAPIDTEELTERARPIARARKKSRVRIGDGP
jgi:hypothetical protein